MEVIPCRYSDEWIAVPQVLEARHWTGKIPEYSSLSWLLADWEPSLPKRSELAGREDTWNLNEVLLLATSSPDTNRPYELKYT